VIFTSNCTDGINLVAHGYGRKYIGAGDEIILTHLEHHANIVPWQMLCEEKGARLRIVPVTDAGEIVLDEYERLFNPADEGSWRLPMSRTRSARSTRSRR
jgi:cysteine desulfurase/selenocysteine lyase